MKRELAFVLIWLALFLIWPAKYVREGAQALGAENYFRYWSIKPGWTEAQLKAKLGNPVRVCTASGDPSGCWVHGYSHPDRQVTGTVYIYTVSGDTIAYVFLSPVGRVEEKCLAGS